MRVFAGFRTASGWASQPLRRGLAGYALAAALMLLLALLLTMLPGRLPPATGAVAFLIAVIAVALGRIAARRARQAAAARAEAEASRPAAAADRARALLLAAVSHDLRTPLAAAKAAVNCLRSGELRLTGEDHDELLATADESLDLLARLAASLLDMSRRQAARCPCFPARPMSGRSSPARSRVSGPRPGRSRSMFRPTCPRSRQTRRSWNGSSPT